MGLNPAVSRCADIVKYIRINGTLPLGADDFLNPEQRAANKTVEDVRAEHLQKKAQNATEPTDNEVITDLAATILANVAINVTDEKYKIKGEQAVAVAKSFCKVYVDMCKFALYGELGSVYNIDEIKTQFDKFIEISNNIANNAIKVTEKYHYHLLVLQALVDFAVNKALTTRTIMQNIIDTQIAALNAAIQATADAQNAFNNLQNPMQGEIDTAQNALDNAIAAEEEKQTALDVAEGTLNEFEEALVEYDKLKEAIETLCEGAADCIDSLKNAAEGIKKLQAERANVLAGTKKDSKFAQYTYGKEIQIYIVDIHEELEKIHTKFADEIEVLNKSPLLLSEAAAQKGLQEYLLANITDPNSYLNGFDVTTVVNPYPYSEVTSLNSGNLAANTQNNSPFIDILGLPAAVLGEKNYNSDLKQIAKCYDAACPTTGTFNSDLNIELVKAVNLYGKEANEENAALDTPLFGVKAENRTGEFYDNIDGIRHYVNQLSTVEKMAAMVERAASGLSITELVKQQEISNFLTSYEAAAEKPKLNLPKVNLNASFLEYFLQKENPEQRDLSLLFKAMQAFIISSDAVLKEMKKVGFDNEDIMSKKAAVVENELDTAIYTVLKPDAMKKTQAIYGKNGGVSNLGVPDNRIEGVTDKLFLSKPESSTDLGLKDWHAQMVAAAKTALQERSIV